MSWYPFDLGAHSMPVSTLSPECQTWFDRGLNWSYAFHHEEAERCFQHAVGADPDCAMAHWGAAYARGPNYNKAWERFDEDDLAESLRVCHEAARRALDLATDPVERALCGALLERFPEKRTGDYNHWNERYADAMAVVYAEHGASLDVAALYADSMMALAPWTLWDLQSGKPNPASRTLEIERVLERAMLDPHSRAHPGILHFYIHLMELSPTPEVALIPGDHLRALVPDGGHLHHMPAHIDLLIGDYRRAIASSRDAVLADQRYLAHGGSKTDFYAFYRLHDMSFGVYAAMLNGQYAVAMEFCDMMDASLQEDTLRIDSPPMVDWMEGFVSYRVHVMVRFGRWEDILARAFPADSEFYCVTTAILHYARGIAFAVSGKVDEAVQEQERFAAARKLINPSRFDFPNTWTDTLDVGEAMLAGEIAYRRGELDEAWRALELAIHRSDNLIYAEPWSWMQPPRHAYGALLLEQGLVERAARVYAEDLGYVPTLPRALRHLNNVWALKGYHECLVKLGKEGEAAIVRPQLELALAVSDIKVGASCLCATSV